MDPALDSLTPQQAAAAGGVVGAVFGVAIVFVIIYYILQVIACWKIFEKAGEKGWKALIPFYNYYILYKIVDMRGWFWGMIALSIVVAVIFSLNGYNPNLPEEQLRLYDYAAHPWVIISLFVTFVAGLAVSIIYAVRTSRAFKHGIGYALGIFFLQPIFLLILGFGKSKYDKKYEHAGIKAKK